VPGLGRVVLLHGLARSEGSFRVMERALVAGGYQVANVGYASTGGPIETLVDVVGQAVQGAVGPVHFVTHSMGGILVRLWLARMRPAEVGRVVMLAPPNRGSPVAGVLSQVLGWVLVPTQELSDRPTSYVNRLGDTANMEVGILAAKYDLLIPLRNTRLASESKHDVVVGTHNSILFSPRVGAKAACFLKTGDWREPSGRK
jgi:pimeloyl-ACP methyl ester carboxylesterase